MQISVIDDEVLLSSRIVKKLQSSGYVASDYTSYRAFFQAGNIYSDLYIVDIALGDGSGFDVIQYLRNNGCESPILILSGYGDTEKVVYGLNLGADDYLSKPFATEVLIARVHALLRRPKKIDMVHTFTYKGIRVNIQSLQVDIHDTPIQLTRKEFLILEQLIKKPEKIVQKDEIITKVWGSQPEDDSINNTVHATISKLRRKLGTHVQVVSVMNTGYKLE